MTEKVCRCEATDNEKTEKTEGSTKTSTKEKLRLFSRKKSNSLNKNVCAKCGLPFANESPLANSPGTNQEQKKVTQQVRDDQIGPLPAIYKQQQEQPKKTRRQSEELPKIPVQETEYHYEKAASDGGGGGIYTEIEELPEKVASVSHPSQAYSTAGSDPLQGNRRRPVSGRVQPGPGQIQSAQQLSNGGVMTYKSTCDCLKCRRQRGQDLTVELLPMDTQVTLQSMMQGSTLMCNLL